MDQAPAPIASQRKRSFLALALLLVLLAIAIYLLFYTPLGAQLRHKDKSAVEGWVARHKVYAPLIIVGIYVLFSIAMLPVWEMQIAAGFGFGLVKGILWCELAAMLGGVASLLMSRWLVGEWFQTRYESRMARLHAINEKLGHNGLLVVMGVRLCHVLPFGVSNYLFGLTRITVMDVIIGTLAGNLPTIAIYVAVGAGPHLLKQWTFWTSLAAINAVLLIPLVLRYVKPQWFRRIGVE